MELHQRNSFSPFLKKHFSKALTISDTAKTKILNIPFINTVIPLENKRGNNDG
jgi:hypothetical protein